MIHIRSAPCTLVLLLILASAALAGPERYMTRATSSWNRILERWETTIQPAPDARRSCTTRMHPQMQHVNVRGQ